MHPEYAETTFGKLFECPVYQSFQFLVFDLLLWVVRCVVFIRVGEDGIPITVAYILVFPLLQGLVTNGPIQIAFYRMKQL